MELDGKHRRYGTWRDSPDAETEQNNDENKKAQKETKEPNFKTANAVQAKLVQRSRTTASTPPHAGRQCTTVEWRRVCGR